MICGRRARPTAEQPRSPPDVSGGPRRPGRALKKMGLTEDEDVQRMLRGSIFRKIKSRGCPRERLFRLQEDGVTVCFEGRFGRTRSQQSFSVMHIEGVREGHQSEGLRKYGAAFPEQHCFTLVFKGKRKNLDLAARGEEDARHWVQGLTKLMGQLQAMSQPEKLDHWIHGVLQRADRNKDNKMSFREVKSMLRMINIDMDDVYAYKLFKECDRSGDERLEGRELEEFCRRLLQRPELEELFRRYSGEDCILSAEELQDFLRDQGEDASLRQARAVIRAYELNEKARQQDLMMLDGFMMYLLSAAGDILNQEHTKVHQDMSQPLCHYFISSSHNTYLTRNQIGGTSSTEAYVRALMAGCRCVELDCWEGSDGEPVVYHGHTLTSKILFRDVIESIRDYAFKRSPYPVILSLENHCGLEQQATMAQHMKAVLGDMLLTQPLEGQDPHDLPSPEQLKGKVLVKGKKLPELWHEPQGVTSLPHKEEEEEEEEEEKLQETSRQRSLQSLQEIKPLQAKDASQVAPELSAMVVYCQAVPFPGLAHALRHPRPYEMSSFSERKARKLIKEAGPALIRYNTRQLSRIYPLGLKMNSSNYNPQEMWNAGCQLVALNFQTPGYEMDLNAGRFLGNGRCGYVLKPPCLRSPPGEGPHHLALHVRVITAQQLPKLNREKGSSIVDPFVRVEIHGIPADCSKQQTHHKLNNGFNPRWEETLSFQLRAPELALVRFVVEDYDSTSCNDFVGQFTLPLGSMREGYRHIHLLSKDGASLSPATLFVHIRCKSL
ncbi:1-phosphatidylinositol 4,5-bisphosphate phosphodiesterase delta-3 [Falco rusticolus]|uniref:1-phosphatidylinositol 4,5-bisphosphate phosphodiesterase delta-3 n=1 Tax=Falco rusticolus TaxID=120794 RepID=UPI00188668C9|nr:1-phosphatidylinositol 4,5-bisphosphate phosphodiesterase delta-3 [Falco rusticolus]XP_055553432.1 1-phosphatidylinositol 4,5-bisphosphate phosphodiesterase delta-3 [Falco cherrug]XP_055645836.1 1-phosphatidylinositol 4,5-bisphosphate phosphodiesterase delta-3 [Falco peregrinus]